MLALPNFCPWRTPCCTHTLYTGDLACTSIFSVGFACVIFLTSLCQKCHVKIKAKCHNFLVKVSQMTRVPQVEYHCCMEPFDRVFKLKHLNKILRPYISDRMLHILLDVSESRNWNIIYYCWRDLTNIRNKRRWLYKYKYVYT